MCTQTKGRPFWGVMCTVGAASQISWCLLKALFWIQNITWAWEHKIYLKNIQEDSLVLFKYTLTISRFLHLKQSPSLIGKAKVLEIHFNTRNFFLWNCFFKTTYRNICNHFCLRNFSQLTIKLKKSKYEREGRSYHYFFKWIQENFLIFSSKEYTMFEKSVALNQLVAVKQ